MPPDKSPRPITLNEVSALLAQLRPALPPRDAERVARFLARIPAPRAASPVRVVASGIDTLYLFSRAAVERAHVTRLEHEKQRLAEKDKRAKGPALDLAGHYFHVSRNGARTAPFLLENEHATLLVNPGAVSKFPTFTCELRALYLWQRGAEAAATEAERIADALLLRLSPEFMPGEDETKLHVGRVDLAVDFQGWEPAESDGPAFTTRSKDRASHTQCGRFTGFMFGHGDVAARLYCKTIEIERSGKGWFREVWRRSPGYDAATPVWRLEFQLRRSALASFRNKGGRGAPPELAAPGALDTWPEVLGHARGVFRHLARRWLALRAPRTEFDRQALRHEWAALVEDGFADGVWGGTDADLYRIHREESAKRATAQLAGYLARGFAEHLFYDQAQGAELARKATFEQALPYIVGRAKQHAANTGRTIEARAHERFGTWSLAAESVAMSDALRIREPGEDDGEDA